MNMDSQFDRGTVIKVIGIGGAGGNAVQHMLTRGVAGVDFIVANTDAQALHLNGAGTKLALGNSGLGAGAKPEAGQQAALASRDEIRAALKGSHMVFITAGMGGGTGTGAAPVVAEIAREMGILTVGVATKPFGFEGNRRMRSADEGIAQLSQYVDSLIVILNDNLLEVMGDDADVDDCFKAADDVLRDAVGGIAEIITYPGLVNVDFEDVRTVMSAMGRAMMGSATAAGADRARVAAELAVASPLLEGASLAGAKGVLVNITAAKTGLKMKEVNEVMNTVKAFASDDAHIIFGAVYDDSMADAMRVTVVATGLDTAAARRQAFEVITPQQAAVAAPAVQMAATGTHDAVGQSMLPPASPLAAPAYQVPQRQAMATRQEPTMNAGVELGAAASDVPAVIRRPQRTNAAVVDAMSRQGVEHFDIPAFLRKQAD